MSRTTSRGWHSVQDRTSRGSPPPPWRTGTLRTVFVCIDEWGWPEAPAQAPMFTGDLPHQDHPLPKALADAAAAKLLRAAQNDRKLLVRVTVEVLLRTGLRVSEYTTLRADAVVEIGRALAARAGREAARGPLPAAARDQLPETPHLAARRRPLRRAAAHPASPGSTSRGHHRTDRLGRVVRVLLRLAILAGGWVRHRLSPPGTAPQPRPRRPCPLTHHRQVHGRG
jgi:hypothetical protein